MDNIILTPEELLKKIMECEERQTHLNQETSTSPSRILSHPKSDQHPSQRSHSVSPRQLAPASQRRGGGKLDGGGTAAALKRDSSPLQRESRGGDHGASTSSSRGTGGPAAVKFTEKLYLNILQSMGQGVHIWDTKRLLIYWNRSAEQIYGYTSDEVVGQDAVEFLVDPHDYAIAHLIIDRVLTGETWTGQFPLLHKNGKLVQVVATNTPFYDDNGSLVGVICVSSDTKSFRDMSSPFWGPKTVGAGSSFRRSRSVASGKFGLNPRQNLPFAIASKISDLASKVSNKVKSKLGVSENTMDGEGGSGDSHNSEKGFVEEDANSSEVGVPIGEFGVCGIFISPSGEEEAIKHISDYGEECEVKPRLQKTFSSKTETSMGKKGISWLWKGSEREGPEEKTPHFVWPWPHNDQENESGHQKSSTKAESETQKANNTEASGRSWSSSFNGNSTSSASSGGSTNSSAVNKVDVESDSLDYEIMWEDCTVLDQIGEGSCSMVYQGQWYGSDVAIKIFSKQVYTDDLLRSFKQEVSLMKRLRHPNILLFMGAITTAERLCIVTEFLARGSLLRILHRNTTKLDWRRRIHMAMDIARGMNYLHHCNPPVIHRDLKSSNLLVDRNWTVKVGDFGLARVKYDTYLTSNTGKGTPQWMAPEVLRNEPSHEKSDVYSYGVVLWELLTQKIPWDHLNSMQVIGAVGFMGHRLEIPKDVDPKWVQILESCWHNEPQRRPTFLELMEKLKELFRHFALQARSATGENFQQES